MARFLLLLFLLFGCFISHAQVNISIYADTVRVLQNTDCDGFLSGDSDFGWLFNARDNNTGLRNNSPVANLYIDSASYATVNGNNGAFAMLPANWCTNAMGGLFFNRNYASCGTMPSSIRIKWLAYENDDALCWANSIAGEGVTSIDSFDVAVGPANSTQTFIRSGASGGICPQQYRISFRVVVTFTSLTGMNMYFADLDGDGFGNRTIFIMACSPPPGYVSNNLDCDDSNPNVNPGAAEICGNNTDDNCNGSTDEGCVVCATSATITPSNFIIICGNQTVTLNASFNGTTDSIRWFKGANPIAGATGNTFSVNKWSVGMYILTGYCNGVPVRDTIMINDFKIGTPGDSTKICTYGLTVLSAPFLAGASYSWRLGSLNGPVVGSNDTLHITGYNGVIWCKITAAGGCSKFAKVKLLPSNFCGSAGKMDLELNESLLIYPNPARDYFRLLFLNEAQELPDWSEWMLLNTNGGVVWQKEIRKEDRKEGIEIDVSQLPSGIYFLRMKGSDLSRRLLISK